MNKDEEQFEAWADRKGLYASDRWIYFDGWQARGEVDAKRIAELEAELAESNSTVAMKAYRHTKAKLAIAVEALDKLSKLGNGYHVGNSTGNCIAFDALTKIKGE